MDDGGEVGALERPLQTGHLVENAAESPNVTLVIVCFTFTLHGREKSEIK